MVAEVVAQVGMIVTTEHRGEDEHHQPADSQTDEDDHVPVSWYETVFEI